MDTVLLPGALWDPTSVGGTGGPYRETRFVQAEMLAGLSYVSAPIGTNGPDGLTLLVTVGAWYHDQLVRTDDG